MIQATVQHGATSYSYAPVKTFKKLDTDFKNDTLNGTLNGTVNGTEMIKKIWEFKYKQNTNILGVISFCIAFGMILSSMGRRAEILLHLFLVLNEITMKLVKLIMWFVVNKKCFPISRKLVKSIILGMHRLAFYS